jgi:hypothetical protein
MSGGTTGVDESKQDNAHQNPQDQQETPNNHETITLNREEYERTIQSETDKRVTEALKTAKKKWEKDTLEKIERERKEAARISQLSEKERHEHLIKKREEELEKKERELSRKQLQLETVKILEERKLPVRFADWLLGEDADATFSNIKIFEEAFNESVNEEIKRRIPARTLKVGSSGDQEQNAQRVFDSMIRRAAGR